MMLEIKTGNIFTSDCQVLVNTINCVGVMGAGIALECRLRYPVMFERYQELCKQKQIDIGKLWIFKGDDRWVLNFPTKKHWKYPSRMEYLHTGLDKFLATYKLRGIESIAFPLLGADRGGIDTDKCLAIMREYLEQADIRVEIYHYDPKAKDDIYDETRDWIISVSPKEIAQRASLRKDYVEKVVDAMNSGRITQLNQLASVQGIGVKTVEKIFALSRQKETQTSMF